MTHPRGFGVKICGITRAEDAVRAVELGADRIGFVFAESPRRIDVTAAAAIARNLTESLIPVGVFVNPSRDDVLAAFDAGAIRLAQFHGDESPEWCADFDRTHAWNKALRASDPTDLHAVLQYGCAEVLIEGKTEGQYGGTGLPMPDDVLEAALTITQRMVWLAGGLGPENIGAVLRRAWGDTEGMRPRGIDASSRLESSPGVKYPDKLYSFFEEIDQVVVERLDLTEQERLPEA